MENGPFSSLIDVGLPTVYLLKMVMFHSYWKTIPNHVGKIMPSTIPKLPCLSIFTYKKDGDFPVLFLYVNAINHPKLPFVPIKD